MHNNLAGCSNDSIGDLSVITSFTPQDSSVSSKTSSSISSNESEDGSIAITFKDSNLLISNKKKIEILENESDGYLIENNLLCFKENKIASFAFQLNFEVESIQVSFASVPTSRVCVGVMNDAGFKLFNDMVIDEKEANYSFAKTLPTDRLILQCREVINAQSISLKTRT